MKTITFIQTVLGILVLISVVLLLSGNVSHVNTETLLVLVISTLKGGFTILVLVAAIILLEMIKTRKALESIQK